MASLPKKVFEHFSEGIIHKTKIYVYLFMTFTIVKDVISSEEEIRPLYEGVLKEFKSEAKINTFLSILVSKKVKELLHARRR
jgi:hypothetical protein